VVNLNLRYVKSEVVPARDNVAANRDRWFTHEEKERQEETARRSRAPLLRRAEISGAVTEADESDPPEPDDGEREQVPDDRGQTVVPGNRWLLPLRVVEASPGGVSL